MTDTGWIEIVKWDDFQHYRDRNPPWIKLYNSLLDDHEIMSQPVRVRWVAVGLLLLASRTDNKIPANPAYLRNRLWLDDTPDLSPLFECGFIQPYSGDGRADNEWASRYVPGPLRNEIFDRDQRCLNCASDENLEIDHIVPISLGGDGDRDNLQVLCRSCNRKKRGELQSAEHDARQMLLRSWDLRRESRAEQSRAETEQRASATARAREAVRGLDALRKLLGVHADVAAAALEVLGTARPWPLAVVGHYGPEGTRRHKLAGLPDEDAIAQVLAESIQALVGEKGAWHQPFFDAIVEKRVTRYVEQSADDEFAGLGEGDRRILEMRKRMEGWGFVSGEEGIA